MNDIKWSQAVVIDALGFDISTYIADDTKFIAYCIHNKGAILNIRNEQLCGRYEPLKNNNGIYLLIGKRGDITNVYVGQALGRKNCCGADRLKDHAKNTSERYYNDWDIALYITKDDNSFDAGVINTLEKSLIELIRGLGKKFVCLNNKEGTSGNVPIEKYVNAFNAIVGLLNEQAFNFCIEEDVKKNTITDGVVDVLNKHNVIGKEGNNREITVTKSDAEAWYERAQYYTQFKSDIVNSSGFVHNGRIYSSTELTNMIKSDEVLTPEEVAKNMVDLIPAEVFNSKSKFLDIYCKSGVFINSIIDRYMKDESLPINSETKFGTDKRARLENLVNNQLFCITPSVEINTYVYSSIIEHIELWLDKILGHTARCTECNIDMPKVALINNLKHLVKNNTKGYELWLQLRDRILKELGLDTGESDDTMKFDVVIGNPPYKKGMDLDFVNIGYELSKQYTVMITPAKWQTAEANQRVMSSITYGEFRKKLVPHMSHVVFYPECSDVFGIAQADGITYYIINKDSHAGTCIVENRCKLQPLWNSVVVRDISKEQPLLNIGNEIINYIGGGRNKWRWTTLPKGRFEVWINLQLLVRGSGGGDSCLLMKDGNTQVVQRPHVLDTDAGESVTSNASACIYRSDNINECRSFESWINCKFTRFFVLTNISKLGSIITDHYWRFVPAPPSGVFDHIYTDEELYRAFNLPQKYIDVIESVIKERK